MTTKLYKIKLGNSLLHSTYYTDVAPVVERLGNTQCLNSYESVGKSQYILTFIPAIYGAQSLQLYTGPWPPR